jgi:hypothetical protein
VGASFFVEDAPYPQGVSPIVIGRTPILSDSASDLSPFLPPFLSEPASQGSERFQRSCRRQIVGDQRSTFTRVSTGQLLGFINAPHIYSHNVSLPYHIRLHPSPLHAYGSPSIPCCPNHTAPRSLECRFIVPLRICGKSWIRTENGCGRTWCRAWVCWIPESGIVEAGGAM